MEIKFRHELINFLIEKFDLKNYLEIGVDNGSNYNKIICESKNSVDPAEGQYKHAIPTHKMTSDEFFKNEAKNYAPFDIVFIDGLHHSEQVDKDIENTIKFLTDDGFIILHDCNPLTEEVQIIPRKKSGVWNGDVWKSVVKFRNSDTELGCVVLDTDHGLGIISNKIKKNKKFEYDLTYKSLEKNREQYIGLIKTIEEILK